MKTLHRVFNKDSRSMEMIDSESINLVVTSPPYPMIEMWDETFAQLNSEIGNALNNYDYRTSFELMHQELDKTWKEVARVLKQGGIACINIGDATRTFQDRFQLFSNHYRIIDQFWELGFDVLPLILWRKQTNAPNKFMGSGMLPAGAYVTLEHEYILVFRKDGKRKFNKQLEKNIRQESAIFWEERNTWFSDLWDFKGAKQNIASLNHNNELRKRSGAFPFMLPYRLINMFSVYGDIVLDPFLGTGTSTLASMTCGRNSIGFEIDKGFIKSLDDKINYPELKVELNNYHLERIKKHKVFIEDYKNSKGHSPKYISTNLKLPVVTRQEVNMKIYLLNEIIKDKNWEYKAIYNDINKENIQTNTGFLHQQELFYQ